MLNPRSGSQRHRHFVGFFNVPVQASSLPATPPLFLFLYLQFDGMVYQQIVGIPMGTNCAPLIADLFLYCYERDFMLNLQKSTQFDLIDKFNDTSRYLDDIFTIDNLNLLSIFLIYIQENFNWIEQILRTMEHFSWI